MSRELGMDSESKSDLSPKAKEIVMHCAKKGDIDELYKVLAKSPDVMSEFEKGPVIETPLHVAVSKGEKMFVLEMMNLFPWLSRKLNSEGNSPLHVAVIERKYETAETMLNHDEELIRVKGKNGNTPLHVATERNYLDFVILFLRHCPKAMDDVKNNGQNVFHISLEKRYVGAFPLLYNVAIRRNDLNALGQKDNQGNSPLHIAVRKNIYEAAKLMIIHGKVKLNQLNLSNKTPYDIALKNGTQGKNVEALLKKHGAVRSKDLPPKDSLLNMFGRQVTPLEFVVKSYFSTMKDFTNEMRDTILIIAVLIATTTYQGVLQPPGGVYGSSAESPHSPAPTPTPTLSKLSRRLLLHSNHNGSNAGVMVMSQHNYDRFVPTNTLAFVLSMVAIIFMLQGRLYTFILHLCLISMVISYVFALSTVSGSSSNIFYMLAAYVSISIAVMAFLIKVIHYTTLAFFGDVWWFPRGSIILFNLLPHIPGGYYILTHIRRLRGLYKILSY